LIEGAAMHQFVSRFVQDESGATAIEYGLIAALLGIIIISGATALGTALNNKLNSIGNSVTAAGS
jgi:pilus assembly protein Flp/PilA